MKTRKRNYRRRTTASKREKRKKNTRKTYKKKRQGGNRFKSFLKNAAKTTAKALTTIPSTTAFKYVPPALRRQDYVFAPIPPAQKYNMKAPPAKTNFLEMFEKKPEPKPFRFLNDEVEEEVSDLDDIFLEDGTINIESLSNIYRSSIYVAPKNETERKVEKLLKDEYKKLIGESPQLRGLEDLESKKSWIGWIGIAAVLNPRALIAENAENVTKGALDLLFLSVRIVVLGTVKGYNLVTPTAIQTKVSESIPKNIQAYGIEGYTLLRAIDSGAFSSIIGLSLSCLDLFKNTDWTKKENVDQFYDRIVQSIVPILPVLLEDISKEGCKTLIPGVIRQVAVKGSLVHRTLSEGYNMLNEEGSLSKGLIENLSDLGNVVVPLISKHMNKEGINCGGDIINDEASGKRCLGEAGYNAGKKYFNESLKLIVESVGNCLKENSLQFMRALITSQVDSPGPIISEEDMKQLEEKIKAQDISAGLLDEITNRYLTSVRNDIKEVRTVAVVHLENDLKTISSPYAAFIRKKLQQQIEEEEDRAQKELEELIEPSFTITSDIFKEAPTETSTISKFFEAREGTVSITKLTTKFDTNALIKLLLLWADNINMKLGENKPYSVTECLLEVIDLRLPHLLSTFFGIRDERLLELANRASTEQIEEVEADKILKAIVEEFVKPLAITVCLEEYIKPEDYNELKMASLFSFFILGKEEYEFVDELD
jgi:hypothetical protein